MWCVFKDSLSPLSPNLSPNRRLHLLPDTKTKNAMLVMVTLNVTLASIWVASDCAGERGLPGYGCLFHVSDHEEKKIVS